MKLILASTSPRRRDIMALLGLPFEVIAPKFEEAAAAGRDIEAEVLDLAMGKAASVARDYPTSIVIGADTMILVDGSKLGKPSGQEDARRMLRMLAGRTHQIFTSVAIIDGSGGPGLKRVEQVRVTMRPYSEDEIDRYLGLDESLDKAGAYSIQGAGRALIQFIEGDYLAAVGLPLRPIAVYLACRGIDVPVDVDKLYAERSVFNWQTY